jgi:hypothetical protein
MRVVYEVSTTYLEQHPDAETVCLVARKRTRFDIRDGKMPEDRETKFGGKSGPWERLVLDAVAHWLRW